MDLVKFSKITESLRQYRRASLKDFESDIGSQPVDRLYVDPLPGGAIQQAVLSSNTTFILGRKGTGKSTVFARAQSELRNRKDVISIYIDVKALYDVLDTKGIPDTELTDVEVSRDAYKSHMLRKITLGKVISELVSEIKECCEKLTLADRLPWFGKKKKYSELMVSLSDIQDRVASLNLEKDEIPVLQKITTQIRQKSQQESSHKSSADAKGTSKVKPSGVEAKLQAGVSLTDFDKTLEDNDIYNEYSDVVLKSFPFSEILSEVQLIVSEAGLARIVVFFDDFSELAFLDQRLFVDVVLSPLNNSSNEAVKLKIAGYPGRVYYGKIDPGKVDTIYLDFYDLYESNEIQEMERNASDYARRLLEKRFEAFGSKLEDYFDVTASVSLDNYMKMVFRSSYNVPRIMGYILHQCYLDKVSKGQKITIASLRLASRKYYENTMRKYFDRLNRYAQEPYENKLDRHNQQQLLENIVGEARNVRKRIVDREVGGKYFEKLGGNPHTSHFMVAPDLVDIFSSLESNFFLSRYKKTRDKHGKDVLVYALFLGLCESERMNWGYPEGREYRNYFVQRCFEYTPVVHLYLSKCKTIRCQRCGFCHPMENRQSIELYRWRCPECMEGICSIVNLSNDFKDEVDKLSREIMLDPIELEIVTVLNDEQRQMRAGEIAALIDTTHQMVGRRTNKLQEMGLIKKERSGEDGKMRSEVTEKCKLTYFHLNNEEFSGL
ncbi:hypothetical protein [Microbulbifer sp. JMSA003]|uniref:hypothetical protein n=1 Tax=Microbulbifer sp. JMSA003 TaxID=3243369 RepID=UPI004039C900